MSITGRVIHRTKGEGTVTKPVNESGKVEVRFDNGLTETVNASELGAIICS